MPRDGPPRQRRPPARYAERADAGERTESSRHARFRVQRRVVSVHAASAARSATDRATRTTDAVVAQRRRGRNDLSIVAIVSLAAAAAGSSRTPAPLAPALTPYDFERLAQFEAPFLIEAQHACRLCGASIWNSEAALCCGGGTKILDAQWNAPISPEYRLLMEHPDASYYSKCINDQLAMTTLGTNPSRAQGGSGLGMPVVYPCMFKLHGRIYHYFEQGLNGGIARSAELDSIVLDSADSHLPPRATQLLTDMRAYMLRHNPIMQRVHTVSEWFTGRAALPEPAPSHLSIKYGTQPAELREVALIMCNNNDAAVQTHSRRSFLIRLRPLPGQASNGACTIPSDHALYEPLQYPLLFEDGQSGFHFRSENGVVVCSTTGRRMTHHDYARASLFQNARLHCFGRLAQAWALDVFSAVEHERLEFLRRDVHVQGYGALRQHRREEHPQLLRARRSDVEAGIPEAGRVYMPATVPGSRRYLQNQIDDDMCRVSRYGIGTFFITFTCNPGWPEIKAEDRPHKKAQDRADLFVRAFRIRLAQLKRDITDGKLFGAGVLYYMRVIEFQKRGLPHAHIVIRLAGRQPTTPEEIDQHISAELPDVSGCPRSAATCDCRAHRLYRLVQQHYIHKHKSRCYNKDGEMTCGYPFAVTPVTHTDERGRVFYRRRTEADRWVAPYNPSLALRHDCHINVELVTHAKFVKYLHKYTHKGRDTISVNLAERLDRDEVLQYETMRYISASEAITRFLDININDAKPSVEALGIHLPGEDFVSIRLDDAEPGQRRPVPVASDKISAFERYFYRPAADEALLYHQYYERYHVGKEGAGLADGGAHEQGDGGDEQGDRGDDVDEAARPAQPVYDEPPPGVARVQLTPRRLTHLARIYRVSPLRMEQYCLRRLVLHKPARSHADYLTIYGVQHATYRDAAIAAGLLVAGEEFDYALRDVVQQEGLPSELRMLFTLILLSESDDIDPVQLYNKYRYAMAMDIPELHWEESDLADPFNKPLPPLVEVILLRRLEQLLASRDVTPWGEFGLPSAPALERTLSTAERMSLTVSVVARELAARPAHRAREEYEAKLPGLKQEQRAALDAFERTLREGRGGFHFIDARAGRGKTWLLRTMAASARALGKIVVPTAFTGIVAATHDGGVTCHRAYGLPVKEDYTARSASRLDGASDYAQLLRAASVLIIDELPMLHAEQLRMIHDLLVRLTGNAEPFGGKLLVGAGDFRQTMPVVERGSRSDVIAASVKNSHLWRHAQIHTLTQPIRDARDPEFSVWADAVGDGVAPGPVAPADRADVHLIDVPDFIRTFEDEKEARAWVHGERLQPESVRDAAARIMLAPHAATVREHNKHFVRALQGAVHAAPSDIDVDEDSGVIRLRAAHAFDVEATGSDSDLASDEYFESIHQSGVPDPVLEVKPGCLLMIMRNLLPELGVLNGGAAELLEATPHRLRVRLLSDGLELSLPRINFKMQSGAITFTRRQFPVMLSYAGTLNKVQGQTKSRVVIDLRSGVFSHGQLYVGITRAQCRDNIALLLPPRNTELEGATGPRRIVNVVYRSIADASLGSRSGSSPSPPPSPSLLATPEPARCVICLDDIDAAATSALVRNNAPVCIHRFHRDCISCWGRIHTACPQCKCPFDAVQGADGALERYEERQQQPDTDDDASVAQQLQRENYGEDEPTAEAEPPDTEGEQCEHCHRGDRADTLLLCDGCNSAHHTACLQPPLSAVPSGHWLCDSCEHNRATLGEELGTFLMSQPRRRAAAFLTESGAGSSAGDLLGVMTAPTIDGCSSGGSFSSSGSSDSNYAAPHRIRQQLIRAGTRMGATPADGTYTWLFIPLALAVVGLASPVINDLRARMGAAFFDRIVGAYRADFHARNIRVLADLPLQPAGELILPQDQERLFVPDAEPAAHLPPSHIPHDLYSVLERWANYQHFAAIVANPHERAHCLQLADLTALETVVMEYDVEQESENANSAVPEHV